MSTENESEQGYLIPFMERRVLKLPSDKVDVLVCTSVIGVGFNLKKSFFSSFSSLPRSAFSLVREERQFIRRLKPKTGKEEVYIESSNNIHIYRKILNDISRSGLEVPS